MKTLITGRRVVTLVVDSAAVTQVDSGGKQAQVLVYAHQNVTNTAVTTARVDQVQLVLTMERVGDRWLTAAAKQV